MENNHIFNVESKDGRIAIVNSIISEIGRKGRKFLSHNENVNYIFYRGNKLFMKIAYKDKTICLNTKYGYPPRAFHHGGTMWGLTKDFKEFIYSGKITNGNNGYGGLYCPHWGYSESDMNEIQNLAKELGYLKS